MMEENYQLSKLRQSMILCGCNSWGKEAQTHNEKQYLVLPFAIYSDIL